MGFLARLSRVVPLLIVMAVAAGLIYVVVTYRHGGEVPPDVRGAVAGAVQRVLGTDPEATQGATQVTDSAVVFSRTRQFASWAVGGQALLSPDDLALARSFRTFRAPERRGSSAWERWRPASRSTSTFWDRNRERRSSSEADISASKWRRPSA